VSEYASGTTVSTERSKNEIEATLRRYGADQFVSGWKDNATMLGFRMGDRMVRFVLPLPAPSQFKTYKATRRASWRSGSSHVHEFTRTRSDQAALVACDQETRRRFRALSLVIKAKLEAVASGITTFEEEFLAHIVLPGGSTVYERTRSELKLAYESGKAPELLLGFGGAK